MTGNNKTSKSEEAKDDGGGHFQGNTDDTDSGVAEGRSRRGFGVKYEEDAEEQILLLSNRSDEKTSKRYQRLSSRCFVFLSATISLQLQYIRFTLKEIQKRKISYCLGFLSCFIVVWMIALSLTALNQVPLVFLRLAEVQEGEYDLRISANRAVVPGQSLNLSSVQLGLSLDSAIQNSFSPRIRDRIGIYTASSCSNFSSNVPYPTPEHYFQDMMDELQYHYMNWTWMYNGRDDSKENQCIHSDVYCVPQYCTEFYDNVEIQLFDSDREKKMGFGRRWDKPKLQRGHTYITYSLAKNLGINKGDVIIIRYNTLPTFVGPYREAGMVTDDLSRPETNYHFRPYMYIPLIVDDILDDYLGKLPAAMLDAIMLEYSFFLPHLSYFLPPSYNSTVRQSLSDVNLDLYADYIYLNIPGNRLNVYNHNDYDVIQEQVIQFASEILYLVGYNQIDSDFPILEYMKTTRFFALFLGLIISIIVTILSGLSVLLIYSLLMINVENRTFELGILRMIGITRKGLIQIVLIQAFFYAIPALVIGLILSQGSYILVNILLKETLQLELSYFLSYNSIILAVVMGLAIPIISAVLPIQAALSANLHDSLDIHRSKTKAVKFKVERSSEGQVSWVQLGLGSGMVAFGFMVYYFFPLSLLTFNLTIMMYMFFGVILAMLFGLIVLSLNLETLISQILAYILFFWENLAVREIVLKNLIAHKIRNRKTTLMYAISLGFIIFIAVSFNLQVITFRYNIIRRYGTRLNLVGTNRNVLKSKDTQVKLETLCKENANIVSGYAFMSYGLDEVTPYDYSNFENLGRYKSDISRVYAISPQFYHTSRTKFLKIYQESNAHGIAAYNLDERLYTAEASSRLLLSASYAEKLAINSDSLVLTELRKSTERFPLFTYRLLKPLALLSSSPSGFFTIFPNEQQMQVINKQDRAAFVSFPTFLRLSNGTFTSIQQIPIYKMLIEIPDWVGDEEVQNFKDSIRKEFFGSGIIINDVEEELQPVSIAVRVMNFFFIFTSVVAMILCFFSLTSSMYTNIHEQAKEIGILRAIGCRRFTIIRIFIYEALLLILTASILGMMIGLVVSYTMTIQRVLFTRLPIDFVFPWEIVLVVFVLSILFSFLSSFFPTSALVKEPIVTILRRMIT